MASLSDVNESQVAENRFEAIPVGWYRALISSDEVKATKAGDGKYLKLSLQIIEDGKFKNRIVFTNLNLWNKNAETVAISNAALKSICEAVNVPWKPDDSSLLHLKPMMIKLAIKPYNGTDQNEVKGYKACLPGASSPQTTTTTSAPKGWK